MQTTLSKIAETCASNDVEVYDTGDSQSIARNNTHSKQEVMTYGKATTKTKTV